MLIKIQNALSIQKQLAEEGIIIRDRSSQPKLEDCLRITVGTHEQNKKLVNSLNKVLNKKNTL